MLDELIKIAQSTGSCLDLGVCDVDRDIVGITGYMDRTTVLRKLMGPHKTCFGSDANGRRFVGFAYTGRVVSGPGFSPYQPVDICVVHDRYTDSDAVVAAGYTAVVRGFQPNLKLQESEFLDFFRRFCDGHPVINPREVVPIDRRIAAANAGRERRKVAETSADAVSVPLSDKDHRLILYYALQGLANALPVWLLDCSEKVQAPLAIAREVVARFRPMCGEGHENHPSS